LEVVCVVLLVRILLGYPRSARIVIVKIILIFITLALFGLTLSLLAILLSIELCGELDLLIMRRILIDLALVVGRNLFDLLVVEQHALPRVVVGSIHRRGLNPRIDSTRRLGL